MLMHLIGISLQLQFYLDPTQEMNLVLNINGKKKKMLINVMFCVSINK